MQLEVRILTPLGERGGLRPQTLQVQLGESATVRDILSQLGAADDGSLTVLVNGRRRDGDHALMPGDRVAVMRPMAGG